MPSKKQYNLVQNDENDTRIPLHSEEAFHRGIVFHAKFIGSMEVPRPTSRMEIVAAMRRIRYEFKAKGIKKKKVTLEVSVDGLKVTLRKKKFPILQKKHQHWLEDGKLTLMHHPIYRIFYVSHDSHDLKIFSYIARDGTGNSFRCNVFKSSKKSQAMRVVRTVGQAFEVCHKLSLNNPSNPTTNHNNQNNNNNNNNMNSNNNNNNNSVNEDDIINEYDDDNTCNNSDKLSCNDALGDGNNHHHHRHNHQRRRRLDSRELDDSYDEEFASLHRHHQRQNRQSSPVSSVHKDISLLGDSVDESILDQPCPQIMSSPQGVEGALVSSSTPDATNCSVGQSALISEQLMNSAELTALKHEIQLLRERLEQQSQQTRAAVAHARLLQDQLAAETAARVEAQARTHQLLVQNKELLEHISALVSHLREHERTNSGSSGGGGGSGGDGVVGGGGTAPLAGSQHYHHNQITAHQGANNDLGQYNQPSPWNPSSLSSSSSSTTATTPIPGNNSSPICQPYPYYPGHHRSPSSYGYANSLLNYADELRYQAQLWDNVRLAVGRGSYAATSTNPPLPPQPRPTSAPASPLGSSRFGLPPSGRSRLPTSTTGSLPRASRQQKPQPRSPSSIAFQQQPRSRSLERPQQQQQQQQRNDSPSIIYPAIKEASFIKPLPGRIESSGIPMPLARSYREEAVQTEAEVIHEPPKDNGLEVDDKKEQDDEEEEEDESGLSEKDDELPELPALNRRNSR